jgi:hypothetical protein
MRRQNVFFCSVSCGIVCLVLATISNATVPRAFVSVNGSDLNPCSAVQPCRSFNQALTVVEAGGEIVVQDSGGYSTGFTINQSVTIDAAGFNASVISTSATDLCAINTTGRVVLRGISFHGASVGANAINVTQAGSLYVEHCSIAEFTNNGVNMPSGGNLFLTGTDVRACGTGIVVASNGTTPANLVAHDSRFAECVSEGVLVESPGNSKPAKGWLKDCTASLCGGAGFKALAGSGFQALMILTNCHSAGNGAGVSSVGGVQQSIIHIINCVIAANSAGIATSGSGIVLGTSPGTSAIAENNPDGNPSAVGVTLK